MLRRSECMKNSVGLDLKAFDYVQLLKAGSALCMQADPRLEREADARGMIYDDNKWNTLANALIFGGSLVYRQDVDLAVAKVAMQYVRLLLRSWEPKHEVKMGIVGMLLSEFMDYDQMAASTGKSTIKKE